MNSEEFVARLLDSARDDAPSAECAARVKRRFGVGIGVAAVAGATKAAAATTSAIASSVEAAGSASSAAVTAGSVGLSAAPASGVAKLWLGALTAGQLTAALATGVGAGAVGIAAVEATEVMSSVRRIDDRPTVVGAVEGRPPANAGVRSEHSAQTPADSTDFRRQDHDLDVRAEVKDPGEPESKGSAAGPSRTLSPKLKPRALGTPPKTEPKEPMSIVAPSIASVTEASDGPDAPEDGLAQEVLWLDRISHTLKSGRPELALRLVRQYRVIYPAGRLSHEASAFERRARELVKNSRGEFSGQ